MPIRVDSPARLIISVDVEDWPQSTWDRSLAITPRAMRNTERVLDILASHGRAATLFVLGKFAERFPDTVRRMARDGHEVASHGYGHVEIFRQTSQQFREDVHRAKHVLEDIIGGPVFGYRAPDFSLVAASVWALDILADLDFQYDSSIFPIRHKRYGIANWPTHPVRVCLRSGQSIVEMPIATLTWAGRRWPVAGGDYHHLLPWPVIRWAIHHGLRSGAPFMAYCHPYEFDRTEFEELDINIPFKTRFHQGFNRRGFQAKFEAMLTTFDVVRASHMALGSPWPEYSWERASQLRTDGLSGRAPGTSPAKP